MTSMLTKIMCRNFNKMKKSSNLLLKREQKGSPIDKAKMPTIKEVISRLGELMGHELKYKPVQSNREHLLQYLPKSQEELPPRKMQDSFCDALLPLSSNIVLQDKYVTFLGRVRLGRLMEDMDMFAVWVAFQHILNPKQPDGVPTPYVLVTILVDQMNFTDLKAKHDADIRLSGHVCWVGRSSLETVVWLEQEVHGQWLKLTRAIFLLAARNSVITEAAVVNPLVATSEYEKNILDGGQKRNLRRKELASHSLMKQLPDETEQHLIHEMFLKTVSFSELSSQSRQLPPNSEWMREAKVSNIIFSHPEDRNLHNKVFGGFLMRHALDLSWVLIYLYTNIQPKLLHIADIGFFKAVDVGSLLQMQAHIVYTEKNYATILVHAQVINPKGVLSTTNNFYYVYELPEEVKKIVPETYHESMLYLDGRRRFHYVMGDSQTKPKPGPASSSLARKRYETEVLEINSSKRERKEN